MAANPQPTFPTSQQIATPMPEVTSADHEFLVIVREDQKHVTLDNWSPVMKVGETLRFSSSGPCRVIYRSPNNPNISFEFSGSTVHRLEAAGKFICQCFATVDGIEIEGDVHGGDPEIKPRP